MLKGTKLTAKKGLLGRRDGYVRLFCTATLLCLCLSTVWSQNDLDATLRKSILLTQEIDSLTRHYADNVEVAIELQNQIKADSAKLDSITNQIKLMQQSANPTILATLENEVRQHREQYNAALDSVSKKRIDLTTLKQRVADNISDIDGMQLYTTIQREQIYDENKAYLDIRFSLMSADKLDAMLASAGQYSDMADFNVFKQNIETTIAHKKQYDKGVKMLDSKYDSDSIWSIMKSIESVLTINTSKGGYSTDDISQLQFIELDSLDIRLSRYIYGMAELQKVVKSINTDKAVIAARTIGNDAQKCIAAIAKYMDPKPNTKAYDTKQRFFQMVPYLERLYIDYWSELRKDPFAVPTSTERIIMSIKAYHKR